MWYAIDTSTGEQVHAINGLRYSTYRCPVCRGSVFLRGGQHRARHFVHRHETAKPECELYTPGANQPDPHRKPIRHLPDSDQIIRDRVQISPPLVCIEVEHHQFSNHPKPPRWNLCVQIPKSVDGYGTMYFDFGNGQPRTIALSKLSRGPVPYPVDPNSNDFRAVWCSPETNSEYQNVVKQCQPGLDKQGVTPFASVSERFKPRALQITCGRAYYFVWPNSFELNFPSGLEIFEFENNQDWSCVLCNIPDSDDKSLVNWLESVCSVDVKKSLSSWSLLYPFLSTITSDGYIDVPDVGNFILGHNQTEASGEDKLQVSLSVNNKLNTLQVPDQPKSVIALDCDGDGPDGLELSGTCQEFFSFHSLESSKMTNSHTVWAVFGSCTEDGSIRVPMHSVAARTWLGKVSLNRAELKKIILPEALVGELAWRTELTAPWNCTRFNCKDSRNLSYVELGLEELAYIQSTLKSANEEVRITFWGSCEYHFFKVKEPENLDVSVSPQLRNRMLWLQKEISIIHGMGQIRPDNLSDNDLIQHFLALTPPPSLVGHFRAIRKSIERQVQSPVGRRHD